MRRNVWLVLLGLAASGVLRAVAGQNASYERLVAARVQLRAMQLDSAAVLLREALDTSGHPVRSDQVEAWLLLGVISFYKGDDSGTAGDFRHAIALDPLLKSDGLARYDSALVGLFDAQRSVAVAGRGPTASLTGDVVDCTRTCPDDVILPRFNSMEALEGLVPDRFTMEHGRWGMMTVRFIVDSGGRVAMGSMQLVTSSMQIKPLEQALLGGLARATFTPPSAGGRRISVMVEGRMGFRTGSFEADVPIVPRRRRP